MASMLDGWMKMKPFQQQSLGVPQVAEFIATVPEKIDPSARSGGKELRRNRPRAGLSRR